MQSGAQAALDLQKTAGNRAVAGAIGGGSGPLQVQRLFGMSKEEKDKAAQAKKEEADRSDLFGGREAKRSAVTKTVEGETTKHDQGATLTDLTGKFSRFNDAARLQRDAAYLDYAEDSKVDEKGISPTEKAQRMEQARNKAWADWKNKWDSAPDELQPFRPSESDDEFARDIRNLANERSTSAALLMGRAARISDKKATKDDVEAESDLTADARAKLAGTPAETFEKYSDPVEGTASALETKAEIVKGVSGDAASKPFEAAAGGMDAVGILGSIATVASGVYSMVVAIKQLFMGKGKKGDALKQLGSGGLDTLRGSMDGTNKSLSVVASASDASGGLLHAIPIVGIVTAGLNLLKSGFDLLGHGMDYFSIREGAAAGDKKHKSEAAAFKTILERAKSVVAKYTVETFTAANSFVASIIELVGAAAHGAGVAIGKAMQGVGAAVNLINKISRKIAFEVEKYQNRKRVDKVFGAAKAGSARDLYQNLDVAVDQVIVSARRGDAGALAIAKALGVEGADLHKGNLMDIRGKMLDGLERDDPDRKKLDAIIER